jgi:HAD superfamily hydrolase (TIGR01509 family)
VIRAAIFDLDGTIVDSNELHVDAWQETFRHFGKEIPRDELHRQIGKGGDQYLPVFLSELEMHQIGEEVESFRSNIFKEKYLERVQPFPKVRELLQRVRDSGKRVALASSGNGDEVDHYVALAELGGLVDCQTTKSDVSASKPRPDVFVASLRKLEMTPEEAVVIGDTPYDVQAAKKTGIATIALLCGGFPEDELRASGAAAIYRDPADLLGKFQQSLLAD